MGLGEIVEVVRTKFGLAPDVAEAAVWTKQLGELNASINKIDAAIAKLEEELPLAVLRSDAGSTTRKLRDLRLEREGLVSAAEATRGKVAEALAREQAAELQVRWDETRELGDALLIAARQADAAAVVLADALRELKAAQLAFHLSLPARVSGFASRIASDGIAAAFDAVKARLRTDASLVSTPSLESLAADEVAVSLHPRPPIREGEKLAEEQQT